MNMKENYLCEITKKYWKPFENTLQFLLDFSQCPKWSGHNAIP